MVNAPQGTGQRIDVSRIRSGIYLGSQFAQEGPVESLKTLCITHVLQLGTGPTMQPTHRNGKLPIEFNGVMVL